MEIERSRIALIKAAHLRSLQKQKNVKVKRVVELKIKVPKVIVPKVIVPKVPRPKRVYVVKSPRPKMSREEKLIRRRENQQKRILQFRLNGTCIKCGQPRLKVTYSEGDIKVYEKITVFCLKHTKSKRLKGEINGTITLSAPVPTDVSNDLPNATTDKTFNDAVKDAAVTPQSDPGSSVLVSPGS